MCLFALTESRFCSFVTVGPRGSTYVSFGTIGDLLLDVFGLIPLSEFYVNLISLPNLSLLSAAYSFVSVSSFSHCNSIHPAFFLTIRN